MSCFFKYSNDTSVHIPKTNELNGIIYYEIHIKVKNVEWFVSHRYRDFNELHEKLVIEQSISKKLLPPKKVIGNRNPAFIEQRRIDLEEYIQNLLGLFRITMPRLFVEFLDLNKYDIIYLLHDLAQYFCSFGDSILCTKKEYTFSILELYAITERTKLPYPPCETKDTYDFSHVLDFCGQLQKINIICVKMCSTLSKDFSIPDMTIGRSNLIPNNLYFDLNAFRCLKILKIVGIKTENITDVSTVKKTVQQLYVHNTLIKNVNQILLCDNIHQNQSNNIDIKTIKDWNKIELLNLTDLSCNLIDDLNEIDYIAKLPLLENLRLTGNPLAGSVDYRPRVLSRFNDRSSDIVLDNEKGTQKELDMALVLSALNQSKIVHNSS